MDGKTFEDCTFELLSKLSPMKLQRSEIPFDSVRELVLNELSGSKKKLMGNEVKKDDDKTISICFDEMEEVTSTSSSNFDDEKSCLESDEGSTKIIHHSESAPNLTHGMESTDDKRKIVNYRERRLVEMRKARVKNYQKDCNTFQWKCDEDSLPKIVEESYRQLVNDTNVAIPTAYFQLVNSLDVYYRSKTWENNCMKLCCELIKNNVFKNCQQLTDVHELTDASDEFRVRELQIQILISLYLFSNQSKINSTHDHIDDAINKLRLIYITADSARMRTFLEEPITDIFINDIDESIARIYDELCISLPLDLNHFDSGFKMIDFDENVGKRRNGNAKKLEMLLAETGDKIVTEKEKKRPRKSESPPKKERKVFVNATPDEKYNEMVKEEIEEVVESTPMAKLRMAANKSGKRCSKRLSELVKLSEERCQVPIRAKRNMEKKLELSKASTPLSSVRRCSKSLLFSNNSPSPRSARVSLGAKFESVGDTTPMRLRNRVEVDGMMTRSRSKEENDTTTRTRKRAQRTQISDWDEKHQREKIGITRDEITRYKEMMKMAKEEKFKSTNNDAQMNRERRIKLKPFDESDSGDGETSSKSIYACHALLNVYNSDIFFDWGKLKKQLVDFNENVEDKREKLQDPSKLFEELKEKYKNERNGRNIKRKAENELLNVAKLKKEEPEETDEDEYEEEL